MRERKDKKRAEKKKSAYVDDGHTVYDMSGLDGGKKADRDDVGLTRSERRAAIKAALGRYMPIVLMTVVCFALVAALLSFWLIH